MSMAFLQLAFDKVPNPNAPMGKRGGGNKKAAPNTPTVANNSIALNAKSGNHNPKSLLKLEHLQNLAAWACEEASVPSLAAFLGRQFASTAEALGVQVDPSSLFQCQRCETILRPGFNCTVRIEKNHAKVRRTHKKHNNFTKNNAVYSCHFCSHLNRKRGTPKGYMKELCPPNPKPPAISKPAEFTVKKSAEIEKGTSSNNEMVKIDKSALPATSVDTSIINDPSTPLLKTKIDETALPPMSTGTPVAYSPATQLPSSGTSLLDTKKRKRNRSAKEPEQFGSNSATTDAEKSVSASSKRKRKSWTSLKEIVERNEHDSKPNIINLTKPVLI